MDMVIYYTQNGFIYSSKGNKKHNRPSFLDFILNDCSPDTIQCFVNLDHSVACLLKWEGLTKEELTTLWNEGVLEKPPYLLKYVSKSIFSIDRGRGYGHPFAIVTDMTQYMDENLTPDLTDDQIFAKLQDTLKVAWSVYNAMRKLNLKPKTLSSPVRTLQNDVLGRLNLPTISDIPDEAGKYAYLTCTGGWIECFKRGFWSRLFDWDISGAYPAQIRELIDFRDGKWEKVTSLPSERPEGMMGYFRTIYDTDADFHPILSTNPNSRNLTLNGEDESYLNLRKIDFVHTRKLAKVKVIDGWVCTPARKTKPLQLCIDRLDMHKQKAEGMDREIIKRLMNGIYGKMLELLKSQGKAFGPLFNSPWASEIENGTHIEVARFCLDNGIMPAYVMTDGVATDIDLLSKGVVSSPELGRWKLDAETPALVIGSSMVALKSKKGKGEFSLNYDKLMGMIQADPSLTELQLDRQGFVSVGEAVEHGWFDKLGDWAIDHRVIPIDCETKRCYTKSPKNFGELTLNQYDSIAWDASMFAENSPMSYKVQEPMG